MGHIISIAHKKVQNPYSLSKLKFCGQLIPWSFLEPPLSFAIFVKFSNCDISGPTNRRILIQDSFFNTFFEHYVLSKINIFF